MLLVLAGSLVFGAMAQLVAHLLCKQGVTGSSPVGSTAHVVSVVLVRCLPVCWWVFPSYFWLLGTVQSLTKPEFVRRAVDDELLAVARK